jgi:ATP-binding cassette subfamily B protein
MAQNSSPFRQFVRLVQLDGGEVSIIFCYALASGVLALAVPLAAQALVNTIAQGLFLQPLLLLTAAVFLGLLLSGILKTLQMALAEAVQQRLFARLGLRLSEIIPRFQVRAFLSHNGPEQLNKFFEVVNVQKSWNKLMLDVPAAFVEVLLSFLFLAFYGPSLLVLGVGSGVAVLLLMLLLGYGGLRSSIRESYAKYDLAGWLEQMGRCHDSIKLGGSYEHFILRADRLIETYLRHRQAHFSVLLRQLGTFYLLNSVAGASILGLGGWMVMQRQISLGQLVAAEIVVLGLLKSSEKLVKSAEPFFDLLTGLDKLHHLLSIPSDPSGGQTLTPPTRGCLVEFREVSYSHIPGHPLLERAHLRLEAGQRVSVVGEEGSGRSTLAQLAVGLLEADKGQVEIEGMEIHSLSPDQRGRHLAWLTDRAELFDTTVEDNITLGRQVSPHDLRWALELSGLHEHLPWLPQGLKTEIQCGGRNLSKAQFLRILLARTLLSRPSVLVIDQNLYALDFERRIETVRSLFEAGQRWTILNLVAETESLALSHRIYWLHKGQLRDLGSPSDLVAQPEGEFARKFPTLFRRLQRRLEEV